MTKKKKFLNVGLVMPIAPIDGCSSEHWLDVKRIITESITMLPEYESNPKIVSEGNGSGLIHKRIVEGLYTSDIVICDVSCKNPNVMFELGMRLAFDKPTIIIKDDQTDYTFDAGVIEHLQYPRDLRYKDIVEFKELLAEKIKATYEEHQADPTVSPFLKSFGTFTVTSLKEKEVSADQFIIEKLSEIQNDMLSLKNNVLTRATIRNLTLHDDRIQQEREKLILPEVKKYLNNISTDTVPSLNDLVRYVSKVLREDHGHPFSPRLVAQISSNYMESNGLRFTS